MTREEALKALQDVEDAMHKLHDDEQGRLHQLTGALSTARMVVGLLFDHAENAKEG